MCVHVFTLQAYIHIQCTYIRVHEISHGRARQASDSLTVVSSLLALFSRQYTQPVWHTTRLHVHCTIYIKRTCMYMYNVYNHVHEHPQRGQFQSLTVACAPSPIRSEVMTWFRSTSGWRCLNSRTTCAMYNHKTLHHWIYASTLTSTVTSLTVISSSQVGL